MGRASAYCSLRDGEEAPDWCLNRVSASLVRDLIASLGETNKVA